MVFVVCLSKSLEKFYFLLHQDGMEFPKEEQKSSKYLKGFKI